MFDFARWLEVEAPAASAARVALPMAHLEHGLGADSERTLTEHLADPETIAELVAGLAAYLDAAPADAGSEHLAVLNAYALAVTVTDERTAALVEECLRRIDNRPTPYPWSLYDGEPIVDVFREVVDDQLAAVDRHR